MKITYIIKFTVSEHAKTQLNDWKAAIALSAFGEFLARLSDTKFTNFITLNDIKDAVRELLVEGKELKITDDKFGGIPYEYNDSYRAYQLPYGNVVNAEVSFDTHNGIGRPIVLQSNGKTMFFLGGESVNTAPLMYSINEARGMGVLDKMEKVEYFTLRHSDALTREFLLKLGTTLFSKLYPGKKDPDEIRHIPEYPGRTPEDPGEPEQQSIPNHLLHGHDDDPIVHPPRKPVNPPKPTLVELMAGTEYAEPLQEHVLEPEETDEKKAAPVEYPVKPETVYRTAALALSNLNLGRIIEAQRILYPASEYWKKITEAELYKELMNDIMYDCDTVVSMIAEGNGPFLENNPRMMDGSQERRPFMLTMNVCRDSGKHSESYSYRIAYMPMMATAELEIKK